MHWCSQQVGFCPLMFLLLGARKEKGAATPADMKVKQGQSLKNPIQGPAWATNADQTCQGLGKWVWKGCRSRSRLKQVCHL